MRSRGQFNSITIKLLAEVALFLTVNCLNFGKRSNWLIVEGFSFDRRSMSVIERAEDFRRT